MRKIFFLLLAMVLLPITAKAASINSIDPMYVTPGETQITISGSGFGDSSVYKYLYFGYTSAYSSSWSDSQIIVTAPYSLYSSGNIELSGSFKTGQTCYGTYCYDKTEYQKLTGPKYYLLPQVTETTKTIYDNGIFEVVGKYFGTTQGSVSLSGNSCRILKWQSNYIKCEVPQIGNQWDSVGYSIRIPDSNNYDLTGSVSYLSSLSNDKYSYEQTYLKKTKVNKVWDKYTGKGVVVAVIDSGVDINNYDLQQNLWINYREKLNNKIDDDKNGYVDDYYGYNFVSNNADMSPSDSHGTMVAGIIAAKKDNSWGIAGIAPNAKIMALKVCSSYGCSDDAIIKAIRYAVDNGADIINLSLGGDGSLGYSPEYDEVIKYAYDKDVLIVAAAGNGDTEGAGTRGQNMDSVKSSPVCNEDKINYLLGVGSVDNNNDRSIWTNYSMQFVDVSAPGEDILGLAVPIYEDGYSFDEKSGTSFSSPMVAGVAALLKEKNPQWKNYELMSQIISRSDEFKNGYNVYGRILNAENIINNDYPVTELDSIYPTVFEGVGKVTVYGKNFYRNMRLHISNANRMGDIPQELMTIYNNYVEIDLNRWDFMATSSEKYTLAVLNGQSSYKQRLQNILEVKSLSRNTVSSKTDNPVTPINQDDSSKNYIISDNTSVNVRAGASATAKIIGVAKKQVKYEMIDNSNSNWYKIKLDTIKTGWVMKKFFRTVDKDVGSEENNSSVTVEPTGNYITSDNYNINIRQKPDSTSAVIGVVLKKGKHEIVDNSNQNWIQVKFNGEKTGWVMRKLVKII